MKKIIAIALLLSTGYGSFSQTGIQQQTDSATNAYNSTTPEENKYQALQQLNLSEKQKLQLQELRNSFKDKKNALDNDPALTDEIRAEKLKELRKEQSGEIKSILTKEQKIKLRRIMMEKKKNTSKSPQENTE